MKHFVLVAALAAPVGASPTLVVHREAYLMGTRVRMAAVDSSRAAGLARLDRALAELESADAELSTWKPESDLTRLNEAPIGTPSPVAPSLCRVLNDVSAWREATDAAFDPAIGRLLDAWGVHRGGRVPDARELAQARKKSGMDRIDFDPARCLVVRQDDVAFDAGAFGKGEALDRAARVAGDGPWMIDLGGHVSVHGHLPGETGWRVAIAHPADRDRPYLAVRPTSGSLSTSGGSERDVGAGGRRIGHILDPRTGEPARFDGSVTVWHERALVADILSTALFVMGPERGLRWADARGIGACYLEPDASGGIRVLMTKAFRTSVLSSDE